MNSAELQLDGSYCPTTFQILTRPRNLRILVNVVPLLTLGIMGGAILPVPSAFATTGIIASTVSMIVIAMCMVYTCDMLLWQSHCLETRDYETLSQAVGGKWYRIFTEVWLVILMVGTLLGSIVQVGETCASGIRLVSANPPGALVDGSGRVIMVIAVVVMSVFVFMRHLRQLEYVGDAGVIVVLIMVIVIVVRSCHLGLPAIGDGEFRIAGFQDLNSFGSAISTYGFMFYIQPVMMPILDEMPPGVYGVKLLQWSARLAICGTAFTMYYLAGFFGAAAFGADTEGNILENSLGGNMHAQAALNIFMAAYIAIGLVPFEWACRHALDSLVVQAFPRLNQPRYVLWRKLGEATAVYGVSLAIALAVPGNSAQIIAVTGATGVLVICYFVPLLNHYLIWFGKAQCQKNPALYGAIVRPVRLSEPGDGLLEDSAHAGTAVDPESDLKAAVKAPAGAEWAEPREYMYKMAHPVIRTFHLVMPPVVLAVGIFASVLTLKALADDTNV